MNLEEKKSVLDKLYYEMWMLNESFFQPNYVYVPSSRCGVENNALLESFLIHARNLFDFFQDKQYPDDINYFDFGVRKIVIELPFNNGMHEINKYLAHLTKERIEKEKPKWNRGKIRENINNGLAEFLNNLPVDIFPTVRY